MAEEREISKEELLARLQSCRSTIVGMAKQIQELQVELKNNVTAYEHRLQEAYKSAKYYEMSRDSYKQKCDLLTRPIARQSVKPKKHKKPQPINQRKQKQIKQPKQQVQMPVHLL